MEDPAQRLVELLETLPAQERIALTAWLVGRGHASLSFGLPQVMPPMRGREATGTVALTLPAGEESQLVTIRLPAERHAELRAWCAEHSFTMAAVVRGLVERFLEQQHPAGGAAQPPPAAGTADDVQDTGHDA